jgi:hypothetical protein
LVSIGLFFFKKREKPEPTNNSLFDDNICIRGDIVVYHHANLI